MTRHQTLYRSLLSSFFCPLILALICMPSYELVAQPAPASFTDRIISEVRIQNVPETAESAVLDAYREAAKNMKWTVPEDLEVTMIQPFFIPKGNGTQVHVSSQDLGEDGVLFILTSDPNIYQRMTKQDLVNYGGKSAFFPAGNLTISVVNRRGAEKPKLELERLRVLHSEQIKVFPMRIPTSIDEMRRKLSSADLADAEGLLTSQVESLCGPDNRTASNDKRAGRLMPVGCTGWLIGNDLALTAGHCDVGERMDIIEFQVPKSSPDGATNPAHPNDQYPVIRSSIRKEYAGIGDDWAVFKVGPNSNTGKLPGVQQGGYFKLSKNARPSNARVTGFGIDNTDPGPGDGRNSDSQTQQTENGEGNPTVNYFDSTAQHGSYFRYTIDTTGGNSGSPVIDENQGNNVAVAIHTNAGCASGGNHGTAADNEDLRSAIRYFVGDLSTVYVDEAQSVQPTTAQKSVLDYRKVENTYTTSKKQSAGAQNYGEGETPAKTSRAGSSPQSPKVPMPENGPELTLDNAFDNASWLLSYSWDNGGSGSSVITFYNDGTFATSQGNSGRWVQRTGDARAFFAFSNGGVPAWSAVYSLTVSNDGRSFSGIQGWSHTSGRPQKGTHSAVRTTFASQPKSLSTLIPGHSETSVDGTPIMKTK